jgi:hypothetical protein
MRQLKFYQGMSSSQWGSIDVNIHAVLPNCIRLQLSQFNMLNQTLKSSSHIFSSPQLPDMIFLGKMVHKLHWVMVYYCFYNLQFIVFKHRLQTTDELKDAIRHEIAAIPEVMTRRAPQNFRVRLQLVRAGI